MGLKYVQILFIVQTINNYKKRIKFWTLLENFNEFKFYLYATTIPNRSTSYFYSNVPPLLYQDIKGGVLSV